MRQASGQLSIFDFVDTEGLRKNTGKKEKEKQKLSPIEMFIKDFDGIVIDDVSNEASVNAKKSESFMLFYKKLSLALKKEAREKGFDKATLTFSHYDISGFLKKGECYVYFSFSVKRYGEPTSLLNEKFLYRSAESERDFTGGINNYCHLKDLCDNARNLCEMELKFEKSA